MTFKFENKMLLKLFFSLLCFVLINCKETVIRTTSGTVRGQTIDVLNRKIDQYLGIPYAVPPIGSLRFAKPKAIEKPIGGIIDATKPKNACIQRIDDNNKDLLGNLTTSEDCLVLNIWSAKKKSNSIKLKPVMFWIHGGGHNIGSIFQSQYNGSVLATKDVVLVSANYRLGLLGFMYAGDESVPGNMGFYDQLLALKWVRENIHLFGGDKNQITIFGESAGSRSVSVQILSPLSSGLFKRAIMQSGANMFNKNRPRVSKDEAINIAKNNAKYVNCTDDKQWLQCLRKADAKQLSIFGGNFPPIEGTEFLPFSAQNAFTYLKFNKDLDIMAGINKDEGSTLAYNADPEMFNRTLTEKDFTNFVERVNPVFHNLNASQISGFYLAHGDTSDAIKWKIYDFYGDINMKCPTYLFTKRYAERSSNKNNVFFYELTHTANGAAYEKEFGISHGADIPFVFGQLLLEPTRHPKVDIEFSEKIVKYWTDFAKYGNRGNHWFNIISHWSEQHTTKTKELNPKYPNTVMINALEYQCNGFWKDYYLD